MGIHLLGRVVDGIRALYEKDLNDAAFEDAIKHGLPNGWFAYNIADGETVDNSKRVRQLATYPSIVCPDWGNYFSERADYGQKVWGGAAREFSMMMADPIPSLLTALQQDQANYFLYKTQSTEPVTTARSFIFPLVDALMAELPAIEKPIAVMMVMQWARSQPECVLPDLFEQRPIHV